MPKSKHGRGKHPHRNKSGSVQPGPGIPQPAPLDMPAAAPAAPAGAASAPPAAAVAAAPKAPRGTQTGAQCGGGNISTALISSRKSEQIGILTGDNCRGFDHIDFRATLIAFTAKMTDFEAARARLMAQLGSEIRDKRVLAAMSRIPREKFVPEESRSLAYEDSPLPIGWQQTISQPYIIALMTEALELTGKEKVLEIGTGSGYQTAILAELAAKVISVERVPALAESARKVLDSLGYKNIEIHLAEETLGWQKEAPYDAIMVTAAAPGIPDDLISTAGYRRPDGNPGRLAVHPGAV